MAEIHDALAGLADEERKYILVRSYPLFAAYYFGFTMADFMGDMVAHTDQHRRTLTMVPAGHTKALAPETPIPVPSGWTTMGELDIGDEVFDENGEVCHVTKVVRFSQRRRYRVNDRDGCSIVADEHHEWKARLEDWQEPRLVETKDLLTRRGRRVRIANCKPLVMPPADLPVHPYVLGVWLGDGHSAGGRITQGRADVAWMRGRLSGLGYETVLGKAGTAFNVVGLNKSLRLLGVLNNKHVPTMYLRAAEDQRLALLQGLMDSDGNVMKRDGQCWFRSTNERLRDAVAELVRSLGRRATKSDTRAVLNGRDCGPCYGVTFYMKDCALIPKKRSRTREAAKYYDHYVRIEEAEDGPAVCISVDSPTAMFLAGENFTPTHNSTTFGKINNIRHICWNPNVRIVLTMSVYEDAEDYIISIENELTDNELLRHDFGPFWNKDDWKTSSFTVAGRQHNDPHSTLEIFGTGSWKQKGHGCEIAVCDDVVTEETSNTIEARRKQSRWFRMCVQTCPRPMWTIDQRYGLQVPPGITWPRDAPYNPTPEDPRYGQLIVVGTPFHPKDLYDELAHDDTYSVLHLDCWTDKEETQPLWPGFWTNEALHAERVSLDSTEPGNFDKRYRCRPMDSSEIVFHRDWFMGTGGFPGCLDTGRSYGELPVDEQGNQMDLFKALGFDPASGLETRFAAWPTFDLLGFPRGGDPGQDPRYLIDEWRGQTGVEELLDVLLDGNPNIPHPGFHRRYRYDVAKVEENGFANLALTHERVRQAKRRGVVIEPHITNRNKLDPIAGVKSMEAVFRDGLARFPYKTAEDRRRSDALIEQFCYFSFDRKGRKRGFTDYVMAWWFAELAIRAGAERREAYRHPSSPFTVANPYYDRGRGSPQRASLTGRLVGGVR